MVVWWCGGGGVWWCGGVAVCSRATRESFATCVRITPPSNFTDSVNLNGAELS